MTPRLLAVAVIVLGTVPLHADTLVLSDGRRIDGRLLAVHDAQIEFQEEGAWRRTLLIARRDIARIEFDTAQPPLTGGSVRDDRAPTMTVPRGMRERNVEVRGRERWSDTGIDVRAGQQIYFASSGEIRWGTKHRKHGAAGEPRSPVDSTRPIPDRPAAALLARIGDGQDIIFIGDELGPFRVRESGRLYLGINDGWLEDNSGSLRVKVSY